MQLSAQHSDNEELIEDDDAGKDDIDVIDACPELMKTTSTREKDDVPTDHAVGPDQIQVQPKIRFPTTVKGKKHCSFRSEWYRLYHWLQYWKEKDATYCYACRRFTTEPRKYWKHLQNVVLGTGIMRWVKMILLHVIDHCKTHMQAMISWP